MTLPSQGKSGKRYKAGHLGRHAEIRGGHGRAESPVEDGGRARAGLSRPAAYRADLAGCAGVTLIKASRPVCRYLDRGNRLNC